LNSRRRLLLLRIVALALGCLMPLQGMATALVLSLGSAHTHKLLPGARLVLDDMRRAPSIRPQRLSHAVLAVGHVHKDGGTARHFHAADDPSVVLVGDVLQSLSDADAGVSPSLAAFVAVLGEAPAWLFEPAATPPPSHLPWAMRTHVPEPPERPPRTA
jgi:hypothetical protein